MNLKHVYTIPEASIIWKKSITAIRHSIHNTDKFDEAKKSLALKKSFGGYIISKEAMESVYGKMKNYVSESTGEIVDAQEVYERRLTKYELMFKEKSGEAATFSSETKFFKHMFDIKSNEDYGYKMMAEEVNKSLEEETHSVFIEEKERNILIHLLSLLKKHQFNLDEQYSSQDKTYRFLGKEGTILLKLDIEIVSISDFPNKDLFCNIKCYINTSDLSKEMANRLQQEIVSKPGISIIFNIN